MYSDGSDQYSFIHRPPGSGCLLGGLAPMKADQNGLGKHTYQSGPTISHRAVCAYLLQLETAHILSQK